MNGDITWALHPGLLRNLESVVPSIHQVSYRATRRSRFYTMHSSSPTLKYMWKSSVTCSVTPLSLFLANTLAVSCSGIHTSVPPFMSILSRTYKYSYHLISLLHFLNLVKWSFPVMLTPILFQYCSNCCHLAFQLYTTQFSRDKSLKWTSNKNSNSKCCKNKR